VDGGVDEYSIRASETAMFQGLPAFPRCLTV
jgi:hypothetical protein